MSLPAVSEEFGRHDGSLAAWYLGYKSYGLEVLYDQPLGFWRLNETSGTLARCLASNNSDGTYTGTYTQNVTGPLIDGLPATLFDGSTAYINIRNPTLTYLQAPAFTLEAWFKTSTVSRSILNGNSKGYSLTLEAAGKLVGGFNDGSARTVTSTAAVNNNLYHHGVVTYDGATVRLYVDGVTTGTPLSIASAPDYTAITSVTIGATGGASAFFNGQIADVAVYDHALTAARVLAHFNAGTGIASGTALTSFNTDKHYDLRAFVNTNIVVPYSQNDLAYWNAAFFTGQTALGMTTGTVVPNFNETWAGGGSSVTLNSSARYQSNLAAAVTVGTSPVSFDSSITDDIQTDFNDGATYYVEALLKGFPAQAATPHFDLTNSFVDFSSSPTYVAGSTDTFSFSTSLVALTAGGDLPLRYNLSSLTHVNKTGLLHVRFRLTSIGAGTATCTIENIRIYPNTKVFNTIDVETRRGALVRTIPPTGVEWKKDAAPMFSRAGSVKNSVSYLKFNTGHAPVLTTGSNKLSVLLRYNEGSGQFIQVLLEHNQTESRLRIFENFVEVFSTPAATNTLTDSTNYFFKVEANSGVVRASIYGSSGIFPTPLVYTTGWQHVQAQATGYLGLWFQPFNYDFILDYLRSPFAQIGSLESSIFLTQTPVRALTLNPKSSVDVDLLTGVTFTNIGDANQSLSITVGDPVPSTRLQRTGTQWVGGLETNMAINIGNPATLRLEGSIFVSTKINGAYRVVLRNSNGLIAYIGKLTNLTANKWNDFSLLVNGQFISGNYFLSIQQAGFFNDVFYLDNLHAWQPTFSWEASSDGGDTWYPFLSAVGTKYSNLSFPLPGNQVKIRGSALDTTAWVAGYEILPVFGYTGHTQP